MPDDLFRASEDDEYYFQEGCYILEHLNDPADPDLSIARARVPPGVTTRLHHLTGTTERYLILAGHGEARIGGAARAVGPGDVLLIAAGVTQQIRNSGAEDLIFLALCTPRFRPANYHED